MEKSTAKIISFFAIAFVAIGLFYSCSCPIDVKNDMSMDCCQTMPHCDPSIGGTKEIKSFITASDPFAVYPAHEFHLGKVPSFTPSMGDSAVLASSPLYKSPPPEPLFIRDLKLRF